MGELFVIAVPVVAFFSALVALARIFSDHRVKVKVIQANASPETVKLMFSRPPRRDLLGELKWGIVTVTTGLGLMGGVLYAAKSPLPDDLSEPFGFAIVIVSAGVGLLAYYAIASRMLRKSAQAPAPAVPVAEW
jgi:hypothetical protein